MSTVDARELETKVQAMYRQVAEDPHGRYHFETGRSLAERLGYPAEILDRVPAGAVDSFAGVGYFFDLATQLEGGRVMDLGSGSGMDSFVAASLSGSSGSVVGVDFTPAQVDKARALADQAGIRNVEFLPGRIEALQAEDASFDLVISNGVINLSADKTAVFAEVARVLAPGGRMVIADIVTARQLPESVVCNVDLWASCIGGASQEDDYEQAIEAAGLRVGKVRENPYEFLSDQARGASERYGVKSICLVAQKPE